VLLAALGAAFLAAPALAGPLQTAVAEHDEFRGSDALADVALRRIHDAGATAFRVDLNWYEVAPETKPAGFRPEDPDDPAYRWDVFDRKVRLLQANGLEPIAAVNNPPGWATSESSPADVAQFGRFMRAAALRYSGRVADVPRVRYWQIWIEPNVSKFFSPQFRNGQLVAPTLYRRLVNAAADSVHAVRSDNSLIAGGLSPFKAKYPNLRAIAPLQFMRALLCMSKGAVPKPTCGDRARFDIWSHHPYTSGGPTHHAAGPDDVSLGDLPEMKRLLDAAVKAHHVVSSQRVRFWVTEFSWDTKPPDPKALPVLLQARWTSEALYRMWQNGISLVTWLQLRDGPYPGNDVQSGLYYRGATVQADRPKPTLTAFRFPFVAYAGAGGLLFWGRTPGGLPAQVVVERKGAGGWRRLASLRTDRYGVFTRRLAGVTAGNGFVRARLAGASSAAAGSQPFSLKPPPDRFIHPFG
jgi:hypothetical protein